jgi:hypothetical protein
VNRMIEAGVSVSLCVERIALRSCFLHKALALSTTTIRNRRNCLRTSLSLSLSLSLTRLARFLPSSSIDLPRVVVSVLQDVVRLPFISAI